MKNNRIVLSLFLAGFSMGAEAMNRIQVKSDLHARVSPEIPEINIDHAKAVLIMRLRNVYGPVNGYVNRNLNAMVRYIEQAHYTVKFLEGLLVTVQGDIGYMRRYFITCDKDQRITGLCSFVTWLEFEIELMRESIKENNEDFENDRDFPNDRICIFGFQDDDMLCSAREDKIDRACQRMVEQGTKKDVCHFNANR